MQDEVINALDIKESGIYLDGTLGGGGHSLEIVRRLVTGKLIANDKDIQAINAAKKRLSDYLDKITFIHGDFKALTQSDDSYDGILLDLGISSYQIDNAERGFSYMKNAPLDMRMDSSSGKSAKDIVNNYSHGELAKVIREYGEERFASRVAAGILKAREIKPIETTIELAKIIEDSIPVKFTRTGGHPAKKTFQAIRIEVNGELEGLYEAVTGLARKLKTNGRMCVISFHSLEDRIIKRAFQYLEADCVCDKKSPICTCNKIKEVKILTDKPLIPTKEETERNSRAATAKLRIISKL